MKASRNDLNESLSRVSDEMAVFQMLPHAQLWIVATGSWRHARARGQVRQSWANVLFVKGKER
jgi:hypothetical protein